MGLYQRAYDAVNGRMKRSGKQVVVEVDLDTPHRVSLVPFGVKGNLPELPVCMVNIILPSDRRGFGNRGVRVEGMVIIHIVCESGYGQHYSVRIADALVANDEPGYWFPEGTYTDNLTENSSLTFSTGSLIPLGIDPDDTDTNTTREVHKLTIPFCYVDGR